MNLQIRTWGIALLLGVGLCLQGCAKYGVDVGGQRVQFPPPTLASPLANADLINENEPWLRYQNAAIDPRVKQVPTEFQEGIKTDPNHYLPKLVAFLIEDAEDDFHAVKRIHDWVADNIVYDTKSFFSGTVAPEGVGLESVLRSGSSVCSGYTTVFKAMAESAGFRTTQVSGYSRSGFAPFRESVDFTPNHAWNAIQIQDQYYLVDTTWSAGGVNDSEDFIKEYSTKYLFSPPSLFLQNHYPSDKAWQLLETAITESEFSVLPFSADRVFASDLAVLTPLARVTPVGKTTRIRVSVPEGKLILAKLQDRGGRPIANRTKLLENDGTTDILVIFPEPGDWILALYVGEATPRQGYTTYKYSLAVRFAFQASEGMPIHFIE
jgi:hypothetical protein